MIWPYLTRHEDRTWLNLPGFFHLFFVAESIFPRFLASRRQDLPLAQRFYGQSAEADPGTAGYWFQWISMDFNGSKDLSEHFRKKSINWFQKSLGHFSWWNINIFKGFQKKSINWLQKNINLPIDLNGFHQTLVDFIDISSIGGFFH